MVMRRNGRLGLALVVLAAGLIGVALPAQADTFNLTSCHISTGCPPAGTIFGTVTLTTAGTGVLIDVVLNDATRFVQTGSGGDSLFLFNDSIAGSTVTGVTTTLNGATTSLTATGITNQPPIMADGTGTFTAAIQCSNNPCNGGSTPNINDLHFTVTNATLAQLETTNDRGNFFVADILCGATVTGCAGQTGPVDVSENVNVPEPGSLLFFGPLMALAWMVGVRRWKRQ